MSEYAQALKKQTVAAVKEEKDVLLISFENGEVKYRINKSEEYKAMKQKEAEESAYKNSLLVGMQRAVEEIDARQAYYRNKNIEEYGYDEYTRDFYYKCPSDTDESEED